MRSEKSVPILNTNHFPLSGKILIEASAGTGKTFSLVTLYLKLLLGLGKDNSVQKAFLVQEILVITFTKHTKKELKNRIRIYIHDFKKTCLKKNENCILYHLFKKIKNLDKAIYLLSQAEQSIHTLEVYTIHEFCYQALKINKFLSNIFFQKKIAKNVYHLYLQSSITFWNECFKNLPKNILNIILKYFKNPSFLLKKVFPFLLNESFVKKKYVKNKLNIVQSYDILIKKIKIFKNTWLKYHKTIFSIINKSQANKKVYTKSNLNRWVNNITIWSLTKSENFNIPKDLKYFQKQYLIEKNYSESVSENEIFEITEKFLKINFSLKSAFIIETIIKIKKHFTQRKQQLGIFEFDDLIQFVISILEKKNKSFINTLAKKYPALLIDEFQDTNYKQYKIFEKIYSSNKHLFVLISDPKQAIYEFRGADISSYIKATKNIKQRYHLEINWRSSKEIIDSINLLFSRTKNIFMHSRIKFISLKSRYKYKQIKFEINGKIQPALRFLLNKERITTISDYKKWISKSYAKYISFWINEGKTKNATITYKNKTEFVSEKNICILVNNKKEAYIMQIALQELNIKTTYLSKRESVFHTNEAIEILWILQAILNPKNEATLKRAISTTIISIQSKKIDCITQKHSFWSNLINQFYKYLIIWEKFGITHVIHKIIINYRVKHQNDTLKKNVPNIDYILQITKLLEIRSNKNKSKHILISWLEKKIVTKNDVPYKDYINIKNNNNYVQIVTIYKSKGLEYPIVCIPFFTTHYNNHNTSKLFNDIKLNLKNEKTLLSEQMRLLYVALTRAIVHCFVGIAFITRKVKKHENYYSNLYKNALGNILKIDKKLSFEELNEILKKIDPNKNIRTTSKIPEFQIKDKEKIVKVNTLSNQIFTRKFQCNYIITSYSNLKKEYKSNILPTKKIYTNTNYNKPEIPQKKVQLTSYAFPKGKKFGIFIHKILKNINFKKKINNDWISHQLIQNDFSKTWSESIKKWIKKILHTPLNSDNLVLSKLSQENCIKELKFFFPIENQLTNKKLYEIFKMSNRPNKNFFPEHLNPIKGMFTGSIDLVFKRKKKYYLLDYKSNWLGDSNYCYAIENIESAIISNYYDLQYQIYSIALHRYLKQRIKNYCFLKHFGGIYVLFLRAIENRNLNTGLFFKLPKLNKIIELNNFFKKIE
ncbi:MAG: exodeoxyribonuclease V subunit beta [Buchnera aphidicola (Nurudea ibofushi)]